MIRNLKTMGLALVAVFAISAMAAAGAQAEKTAEFWAATGTVKIDSTADSAHQVFAFGIGTLTCTGVTGHAAYSGVSASQTFTNVGYTNCHKTVLGLNLPATVTMAAGCHYTYTAGTYTNSGLGLSHGSVHICGFTVDVYHGAHPPSSKRCETHIPAQTVNNVTYRNGTGPNGKMAVTIEANGVSLANTTITDFNTLGCNTHETITASYTGSIWIEGTDAPINPTDVTVTGT